MLCGATNMWQYDARSISSELLLSVQFPRNAQRKSVSGDLSVCDFMIYSFINANKCLRSGSIGNQS